MRIVTYNVRYFGHGLKGLASTAANKASIAAALASLHPLPDVVCLQELETSSIRAGVAERDLRPGETQLEAFMRHLSAEFHRAGLVMPYQPWYFPAHSYGLGPVKLYTTGLAMLVNAQALGVLTHNQAAPESITHYGFEPVRTVKQTRIVAHLHLEDVKGRRFHVFNTHLSLPTPWRRAFWKKGPKMGHGPNQLEEARAVVRYAAQRSGAEPYLIGGDFNSLPASPVYRYLTEEARLYGAQEALRHIDLLKPDSFASAGFMNLRMHLDHLFAAQGVEWIDLVDTAHFGDETGRFYGLSDHVPLIANFEL